MILTYNFKYKTGGQPNRHRTQLTTMKFNDLKNDLNLTTLA